MQPISWHPEKPPSRGATAYHNAVINASWHVNNIGELVQMAKNLCSGDARYITGQAISINGGMY